MTSENAHGRALQLIAQARVEGIAEADSTWLRTHLEECDSCTEHARQTDRSLRLMRTAAISLPEGLASRTQFRVRLRAQELREREPKRRALWLACAVSWAFGIASAPYVWSLFQWFGQRTGVPKLVWEVGFGLWWTIPALFAAAVLLMENSRKGEQADWIGQGN
jgi:predicted anti-sigma-YlaC factor YlaD